MPFKHRVNEGFMNCTDCHNPHGSFAPTWEMGDRPRMVDQAEGNEAPCLKCHADKRGPFAYEHPPVRVEGLRGVPHTARIHERQTAARGRWSSRSACAATTARTVSARATTALRLLSNTHNMLDPRYQTLHALPCAHPRLEQRRVFLR